MLQEQSFERAPATSSIIPARAVTEEDWTPLVSVGEPPLKGGHGPDHPPGAPNGGEGRVAFFAGNSGFFGLLTESGKVAGTDPLSHANHTVGQPLVMDGGT